MKNNKLMRMRRKIQESRRCQIRNKMNVEKRAEVSGPVVIPTVNRLSGFAVERKPHGQDTCSVQVCGLHTFDEGLSFYKILEAFNVYVDAVGMSPSQVDRMLVVISPVKTFIYVNEKFSAMARCRLKKSCSKGQMLFTDDIVDAEGLSLEHIEVPANSGFLLLMSSGWRKGMCFDLRALMPEPLSTSQESRSYIEKMGGMLLSHLWFTERSLITSSQWDQIIDMGWFPFSMMTEICWNSLFDTIIHGENTGHAEELIHKSFLENIDGRIQSWESNKYLKGHFEFLNDAVDLYRQEKWAPSISIALPRVEGILRKAFGISGCKTGPLLEALDAEMLGREHSKSLLFPRQLRDYFEKNIFPYTDFNEERLPLTRHTTAHGLAGYDQFTRKHALTILMLIDHLLYCMPA